MAAWAADRVSYQDIYERYRTLLAESNWSELLDFGSELQDNRLATDMRIFEAVKVSLAGQWKEAWSLIENLREKNRVASSSDELVSNDPQINAVKKLIRLTDFGARDLFCIEIVAIVARSHQWNVVRSLVSAAESIAAKEACRAAAIGELVSPHSLRSDGWKLLLELLEANRDAGIDSSNDNLRAINLALSAREREDALKLMEVAESCRDAFNCFKAILKVADKVEDSCEFVLSLLDTVKYCKDLIDYCTEAVNFAFTNLSNCNIWTLVYKIAKFVKRHRIMKLEPNRISITDADSDCEPESDQGNTAIHWDWILELLICLAECNERFMNKSDSKGQRKLEDYLMTSLKESIRRKNWCVVYQILSLLNADDSGRLRNFLLSQKIISQLSGAQSIYCALTKLLALKNNKRLIWLQCCALLHCLAADELTEVEVNNIFIFLFLKPDLSTIVESLIEEEVSQFYKTCDFPSHTKPLGIVATLDEADYNNEFLKLAYSHARTRSCKLADKLKEILKERGIFMSQAEISSATCRCKICELNRLNYACIRVSTSSSGDHQRATAPSVRQEVVHLVSFVRCCKYKVRSCCICKCSQGRSCSCVRELIRLAADDNDWNSVLRVVQRDEQQAKMATDSYLEKSKAQDFSRGVDISTHLKMVELSISCNDWEYTRDIILCSNSQYFLSEGFKSSVFCAFCGQNVELGFNLLKAASKESNIFFQQCCLELAKKCWYFIFLKEENYLRLQGLLRNTFQVFRDHLHVKKLLAMIDSPSQVESWLKEVTNSVCTCQDYQLLRPVRSIKTLFSVDGCHLTRNSLSLILWPAVNSYGNWQLTVLLLKEMTDSRDRDRKCLAILPDVIKQKQTRSACAILRLISDDRDLTSKRNYYCLKFSNLIGKAETVHLLRNLTRVVAKEEVIKRCHFQAFIGALTTRNTSVILYIIRSKFRPDFSHPDILHFLSNEALTGELELIDLIFSELKQCAEENSSIDVPFSIECHEMIATVLFKSMSDGHVALANAVLKYADTKYRNKNSENGYEVGTTLLIASACCGHHELVEEIIKLHAPVDEVDDKGRTALSWASIGGHIKTVKILVKKGAKIQHKDRAGETCLQLAKSHNQLDVLKLLQFRHRGSSPWSAEADDAALSMRLHDRLNQSGFNQHRSLKLQKLADFLQQLVCDITQEDWHMTGSYADGWGNSLVQVNGRTAADSDIDWTVIVRPSNNNDACGTEEAVKNREKLQFHLIGECKCSGEVKKLEVKDGHAIVKWPAGSQPASASGACGIRPAQDICHAYACCSAYMHDRVRTLLPNATPEPVHLVTATVPSRNDEMRLSTLLPNATPEPVHLVTATGPSRSDEMRLSFSFREKEIMRGLTTEKGQLFVLIKFLFKRLLSKTWQTSGLKTYHARSCLFFMLEQKPESIDWKPENLVAFLRETLSKIVSDDKLPNDVFMKHFFMPDSKLYLKNAGIGDPFKKTKRDVVNRLWQVLNDFQILENELAKLLEPLKSKDFHFHPFALMPLTVPTEDIEAMGNRKFARMYSVVFLCLRELHSDDWDREEVLRLIEMLPDCCKSARLCLKVMCYLKESNRSEAQQVLLCEKSHSVLRCLSEENVERMANLEEDWLWRFCFVYCDQPQMKFLPEFSRSLIRAKRPVKGAAHLYVNFRSLWWSLQAEILEDSRLPEAWINELRASPDSEDFEELQTLAKFSYELTCLKFCAQKMEVMDKENRLRPNEKQFLVDYLERKQKEVSQHGPYNTRLCMKNLSS